MRAQVEPILVVIAHRFAASVGATGVVSRIPLGASVSTVMHFGASPGRASVGERPTPLGAESRAHDKTTWGTNLTAEIATDGSKRLGRWGQVALLLGYRRWHPLDRCGNHPFLHVAGYVMPGCYRAIAVPGRVLRNRQTVFVLER